MTRNFDEIFYQALEQGGVDSWFGYNDVLEELEEQGVDWDSLHDSEKLQYLEDAGVDGWSCYLDCYEDAKNSFM